MSEIKNGGPAFPQLKALTHKTPAYAEAQNVGGMSLRDYFAAKALQGLVSSSDWLREEGETDEAFRNDTARVAYVYADAMLRAREAS